MLLVDWFAGCAPDLIKIFTDILWLQVASAIQVISNRPVSAFHWKAAVASMKDSITRCVLEFFNSVLLISMTIKTIASTQSVV